MIDAIANNRALFDIYQRNLQKLEEQPGGSCASIIFSHSQ
jgi:hypothetical protein